MRRLFALVALSVVGFATLVAVASAAGAVGTPAGIFASGALDCDRPCWQGIIPGATRVEAARALLARSPFVVPGSVRVNVEGGEGRLSWRLVQRNSAADPAYGEALLRDGVVVQVQLGGGFRLGELVAIMGHPAEVWVQAGGVTDRDWMAAVLVYPEMGVSAATLSGRLGQLSPEFKIDWVFFSERIGRLAPIPGDRDWQWIEIELPWQGFTPARYVADVFR